MKQFEVPVTSEGAIRLTNDNLNTTSKIQSALFIAALTHFKRILDPFLDNSYILTHSFMDNLKVEMI